MIAIETMSEITVWLKGSTPHVEGGLRVAIDSYDMLIERLAELEWLNLELVGGGVVSIRSSEIIAFQFD